MKRTPSIATAFSVHLHPTCDECAGDIEEKKENRKKRVYSTNRSQEKSERCLYLLIKVKIKM